MYPPLSVVYPKNRIKSVIVLSDGTQNGNEFSIAKLLLHDGSIALGIRWDFSEWSPDPDKGYPLIRGQFPCWFILPNAQRLKDVFNEINIEDFVAPDSSK